MNRDKFRAFSILNGQRNESNSSILKEGKEISNLNNNMQSVQLSRF